MFKQVISLAVNYNRPFLSLQLWEKREIIEQIFNIVVFGQMLKYLKKNNVEIKTKNEVNERTIKILEENLKSLRRRVSELTEAQSNFKTNKEKDLKDIDDKIKQYLSEKIKNDEEVENVTINIDDTKYDEEKLKQLKIERDKVIKNINENEFTIKNSTEQITLLDHNTVCPYCKNDITLKHKDFEIKRLSDENKERVESIKGLKIHKIEIEREIFKQETYLQEINDFKSKKEALQDKINIIDREITSNEERRNEILNREIDFNLESLIQEFEDKKNEYKIIWNENKNIKKKLKNNDIIQSILSESGIKAYFFKKLIPILNSKINEYIKLFELPVIIQFDELMNEKITNLENLRSEISYYAYSEGEKKRIDMAILLSFINITKTISNWNCNLLIIDELLDSAIDEAGLEKMVNSLKNMSFDSKELCIYIISHRLQQEYSTHFKNCITIQKNNNSFSEVIFSKED
jgi:DNA repair exonuclease SbcCD ATPase subunit